MTYTFTIPAGSHQVTLKFAEYYHNGPGQRLFNVTVNGVQVVDANGNALSSQVLTDFDIYAQAGGQAKAVDRTFNIKAANVSTMTIVFTTVTDEAQINGILIY